MEKIKVPKRDLYLLLMGILLAFLIQVVYEMLNEVVNGDINLNWIWIQLGLAAIDSIGLGWMIIAKLEEE
jgi:hypothetical protein